MAARWYLGYVPRVLLHAANLRHVTDNFTSLPKEDVLRIFYRPLKFRRLRPGLNPRTWVSEASTLPPHHRSRWNKNKHRFYNNTNPLFHILVNTKWRGKIKRNSLNMLRLYITVLWSDLIKIRIWSFLKIRFCFILPIFNYVITDRERILKQPQEWEKMRWKVNLKHLSSLL
jgi:hypothetical protein